MATFKAFGSTICQFPCYLTAICLKTWANQHYTEQMEMNCKKSALRASFWAVCGFAHVDISAPMHGWWENIDLKTAHKNFMNHAWLDGGYQQ